MQLHLLETEISASENFIKIESTAPRVERFLPNIDRHQFAF